jgi:hypothetical protein
LDLLHAADLADYALLGNPQCILGPSGIELNLD